MWVWKVVCLFKTWGGQVYPLSLSQLGTPSYFGWTGWRVSLLGSYVILFSFTWFSLLNHLCRLKADSTWMCDDVWILRVDGKCLSSSEKHSVDEHGAALLKRVSVTLTQLLQKIVFSIDRNEIMFSYETWSFAVHKESEVNIKTASCLFSDYSKKYKY